MVYSIHIMKCTLKWRVHCVLNSATRKKKKLAQRVCVATEIGLHCIGCVSEQSIVLDTHTHKDKNRRTLTLSTEINLFNFYSWFSYFDQLSWSTGEKFNSKILKKSFFSNVVYLNQWKSGQCSQLQTFPSVIVEPNTDCAAYQIDWAIDLTDTEESIYFFSQYQRAYARRVQHTDYFKNVHK